MATHSSITAGRISWTDKPVKLHSSWGHKELDRLWLFLKSIAEPANWKAMCTMRGIQGIAKLSGHLSNLGKPYCLEKRGCCRDWWSNLRQSPVRWCWISGNRSCVRLLHLPDEMNILSLPLLLPPEGVQALPSTLPLALWDLFCNCLIGSSRVLWYRKWKKNYKDYRKAAKDKRGMNCG